MRWGPWLEGPISIRSGLVGARVLDRGGTTFTSESKARDMLFLFHQEASSKITMVRVGSKVPYERGEWVPLKIKKWLPSVTSPCVSLTWGTNIFSSLTRETSSWTLSTRGTKIGDSLMSTQRCSSYLSPTYQRPTVFRGAAFKRGRSVDKKSTTTRRYGNMAR